MYSSPIALSCQNVIFGSSQTIRKKKLIWLLLVVSGVLTLAHKEGNCFLRVHQSVVWELFIGTSKLSWRVFLGITQEDVSLCFQLWELDLIYWALWKGGPWMLWGAYCRISGSSQQIHTTLDFASWSFVITEILPLLSFLFSRVCLYSSLSHVTKLLNRRPNMNLWQPTIIQGYP